MGGRGSGRIPAIPYDREQEVIDLYEKFETTRIVAEAYGVSDETVRRLLKKHGIKRTHRHDGERQRALDATNRHKGIDTSAVCEMYAAGKSESEIASVFGCTVQTAQYHLNKGGAISLSKRREDKKRQDQEIASLYDRGYSNRQIAEQYGLCPQVVSSIARRCGCKMRGRNNGPLHKVECKSCGKEFLTRRRTKEFCSARCTRAYHSALRSDLKRANSEKVEHIPLRLVYERDAGRCYICGRMTDWNDYRLVNGHKVVGKRYPTRDHVVALNNGGEHSWQNIRLACFSCNSKKSDKDLKALAV